MPFHELDIITKSKAYYLTKFNLLIQDIKVLNIILARFNGIYTLYIISGTVFFFRSKSRQITDIYHTYNFGLSEKKKVNKLWGQGKQHNSFAKKITLWYLTFK